MLHEVKSAYRDIARHFPGLEGRLPTTERKRRNLLDMARRGLPRPSQKTKIGRSLSDYTSPANRSYNPRFHREIKKARPDWFMSQTEVASMKKAELLDMARMGLPRPSHDKTRLGQALSNYTRKSSPVYDPTFDSKIRNLRPDWFAPQGNKTKCSTK